MEHFNTQKTKTVSARITLSDAEKLQDIANRHFNGKMGTLFRLAIEEFIEEVEYENN